jgi:hypothetical protein
MEISTEPFCHPHTHRGMSDKDWTAEVGVRAAENVNKIVEASRFGHLEASLTASRLEAQKEILLSRLDTSKEIAASRLDQTKEIAAFREKLEEKIAELRAVALGAGRFDRGERGFDHVRPFQPLAPVPVVNTTGAAIAVGASATLPVTGAVLGSNLG